MPPIKLYLHVDSTSAPPGVTIRDFTCIYRSSHGACSLPDLCSFFLAAYSAKHGVISSNQISIFADDDDAEKNTRALDASYADFADGEDFFIRVGLPSSTRPSPPPPAPAAAAAPAPPKPPADPIATAQKLFKKKQYRKARILLEGVPESHASLRLLGKIAFANAVWSTALKHFHKIIAPSMADASNTTASSDDFVWCGRACAGQGDFDEALEVFEVATKIYQDNEKKEQEKGIQKLTYSLNDMIVYMGVCHKNLGKVNESAAITEMVLKRDEKHTDALLNYADLAARMGKNEDAVSILLRVIVLDQSCEEAKKLLAKEVKTADGIDNIRVNLPASPETAPAYAFLGTVTRDAGAIKEHCELLRIASEQQPRSTSYALNYAHSLELVGRWEDCFRYFEEFLPVCGETMNCHEILKIIKSQKSVFGSASGVSQQRMQWVLETASARCHAKVDGAAPLNIGKADNAARQKLSDVALDLLALLFTLVKVLYNCGNLGVLPDLIKLIEPVRLASKEELHKTSIRNEAAYYCCVAQLLGVDGPRKCVWGAERQAATGAPVYVCGDSHALPPAWKVINKRLLVPKLVTGLKHWHLREESEFYPKKSFHKVVREIPKGAEVVFVFGEIDCREGLLLAVEKDRYESVEAGIDVCVGIWMKEAEKVVKEMGFSKVWVHPVVPVLNETRSVVCKYNLALKRAMDACDWGSFMDCFDDMLAVAPKGDGYVLPKKYDLDGTHMHPDYLGLLEQFIR